MISPNAIAALELRGFREAGRPLLPCKRKELRRQGSLGTNLQDVGVRLPCPSAIGTAAVHLLVESICSSLFDEILHSGKVSENSHAPALKLPIYGFRAPTASLIPGWGSYSENAPYSRCPKSLHFPSATGKNAGPADRIFATDELRRNGRGVEPKDAAQQVPSRSIGPALNSIRSEPLDGSHQRR